jgi:peroxiredoxin
MNSIIFNNAFSVPRNHKSEIINLKSAVLICLSAFCLLPNLYSQKLTVDATIIETAVLLYPNAAKTEEGPFDLQFKVDMRMPKAGITILNYTLMSGESEIGPVTRVKSLALADSVKNLELLIRYAEDGSVVRAIPIVPTEAEDESDLESLLKFYIAKHPERVHDIVQFVNEGLTIGAKMRDIKAPLRPPDGYVLDITQKVMKPGDKLPAIKTKTATGESFDTQKLGGKPLAMVFSAATCGRCPEMLSNMNEAVERLKIRDQLVLAYVVHGDANESKQHVEQSRVDGTIIPDPEGQLTKLLNVPFKPYAMMFTGDGSLKYNVHWTDVNKLGGVLDILVHGKPSKE